MMMADLTIRGLDEATTEQLRLEATRRGSSMNAVVKDLLRNGLGLARPSPQRRHSDLDDLAGTWSDEDAREFEQAVALFEQVDPELWR
jgi:plasmid stability protein